MVIDFGLSKDCCDLDVELKSFVGSKHFMAPEILEEMVHSYPCDIWSMGIMLFMMLSGNYPFSLRDLEKEIKEAPILFIGP